MTERGWESVGSCLRRNDGGRRGVGDWGACWLGVGAQSVGRDRLGDMRLRRLLLISLGSVLFVLLVIILIQSGLGVDSDVTITDSNRPEIVGD